MSSTRQTSLRTKKAFTDSPFWNCFRAINLRSSVEFMNFSLWSKSQIARENLSKDKSDTRIVGFSHSELPSLMRFASQATSVRIIFCSDSLSSEYLRADADALNFNSLSQSSFDYSLTTFHGWNLLRNCRNCMTTISSKSYQKHDTKSYRVSIENWMSDSDDEIRFRKLKRVVVER